MSGSSVLCGIQSFLRYRSLQQRSKVWVRIKTQGETSYHEDMKNWDEKEALLFLNQQKCEIYRPNGKKICKLLIAWFMKYDDGW